MRCGIGRLTQALGRMQSHAKIDAFGKDIRAGDWVRVLQAPLSIVGMPQDSLVAFSAAIGHTFQVLAFDQTGCVELELWQKLPLRDTIWLEPFCCQRTRRPSHPGRFFQRHQAWLASPPGNAT